MAVKGIKIEHEGNEEIKRLIESYTNAVSEFLSIAISGNITSLGKLNGYRQEIKKKYNISGYTSVLAIKDALAIQKSWKRRKKKKEPEVKKNYMKVLIPYNAKLMKDYRLRVTKQRGDYIYLKLKVGKYQKPFLDAILKEKLKVGEIVIKEDYCVFPVKKEAETFEPEGILSLDINEKSIVGAVLKNGEVEFVEWSLDEVFRIASNCFDRVRRFNKKYPNKHRLWKRITSKYYQNRNRRMDWYLHNILNDIVNLAERKKLVIVMENLKHIKKGVNRRKIKRNKYNNKLQPHRTRYKSLLGRLNRWMPRKIQFLINYKCNWNGIPVEYVNPYNTSKLCPRCEAKVEGFDWTCKCGLGRDRHRIAALNIAKRTEYEGLWFEPDWQVMTMSLSATIS